MSLVQQKQRVNMELILQPRRLLRAFVKVSLSLLIFLNLQPFGYCLDFCFQGPNEGRRLNSEVIEKVHAGTGVECIYFCARDNEACRSTNFKKCSNLEKNCEFLQDIASEISAKHFHRHKEFDYYELTNPNRTKTCTKPGQIYSSVLKQCYLVSSCKDLLLNKPSLPDGAYTLQLNRYSTPYKAYCHMTDIPGCGAGGWTLVLKVDGNKPNFYYNSSLWTNKESYAVEDGLEGLERKESKLDSYWNTPFKKVCLGMTVNGDRRWMVIKYKAHSLYNLITDGEYRNTDAGKSIWKSLIANSILQEKCNLQGFNILNKIFSRRGTHFGIKARIGLIANNEDHCDSPDSWIGFGVSHHGFYQKVNLACGEYNRWRENILTFGYILVQ